MPSGCADALADPTTDVNYLGIVGGYSLFSGTSMARQGSESAKSNADSCSAKSDARLPEADCRTAEECPQSGRRGLQGHVDADAQLPAPALSVKGAGHVSWQSLEVLHVHHASDGLDGALDLRGDGELVAERDMDLAALVHQHDEADGRAAAVGEALGDGVDGLGIAHEDSRPVTICAAALSSISTP